MKKIIATIIAVVFLSVPAMADSFKLILPVKPGGGTAATAERLAAGLKSLGHEAELQFLGNCKLGEKMYNEAKSEVIFMMPTSVWSTGCHLGADVSNNTFLTPANLTALAIVRLANRPELTLQHFLDPSKPKKVGTSYSFVNAVQGWMNDTGQKNVEVINFGNSGKTKIAALTNDADYYVVWTSFSVTQDKLVTIAQTGLVKDTKINAPLLKDVSKIKNPILIDGNIVLIKNAKNFKKTKSTFVKATKTPVYKKFMQRPGTTDVTSLKTSEVNQLLDVYKSTFLTK